MQAVTKLLLLAMFAFAARYSPDVISDPHPRGIPDAGNEFASDARRLLSECTGKTYLTLVAYAPTDTLYEDSRPSTCQALLLMGVRELGLGK